jgi:plasmid stabilization system protein ParE
MRLRFLGRSAEQVVDLDKRWRRNRPKAPALFAKELADAVRLLKTAPEAGSLYPERAAQGIRRVLLPKTQYYLYYVYDRESSLIGVLAVWSCLRGRPPGLRSVRERPKRGE